MNRTNQVNRGVVLALVAWVWMSVGQLATAQTTSSQKLVPDNSFQCVARPLGRMTDVSYLQHLQVYLPRILELRKMKPTPHEGTFDVLVQNFQKQFYRPHDVVCIVGKGVTVDQMRQAGVFETSGGDAILLTPLASASYDLIRANAPTPFRTTGDSLERILSESFLGAKLEARMRACGLEPSVGCSQAAERGVVRDKQQMQSLFTTAQPQQQAVIRVFTYDLTPVDAHAEEANARVWNDFVTAVVAQEATMAPAYQPLYSNSAAFNVWSQDLKSPVHAYSLRDYLGNFVVSAATRTAYDRLLQVGRDFNEDVDIAPIVVPKSALAPVAFNVYSKADALSEMVRAYLCRGGSGSMLAVADLDSDLQLTFATYRPLACDTYGYQNTRVVDFRPLLSKDLAFVRSDLAQLSLESKLTEIQAQLAQLSSIQARSLKTLLAIEGFVGQSFYDTRIAELRSQLEQLQAAAGGPGFFEVVTALGGVASGVSEFTNGLSVLKALLSAAPTSSMSGLTSYYVDKSDDFKKSAANLSSGYSAVERNGPIVLVALDQVLDPGSHDDAITAVRNQLSALQAQKSALLVEVASQVRVADADLVAIYATLYRLTEAQQTMRRDVLNSLYPLVGLNFLSDAVGGTIVSIKQCISGIQPWADGTKTSTVPVLQGCLGSTPSLATLRSCQSNAQDANNVLAVLGKTQSYLIGTGSDATGCFKTRP